MRASFPSPQDLKQGDDQQLRWAVRSIDGKQSDETSSSGTAEGSAFIFVNNYERFFKLSKKANVQLEACGIKLPKLSIPSGCMAIFPVNIDGIRYATAQLVARRDGKTLKNVKPRGTDKPVCDNIYMITKQEAEFLFLKGKKPVTADVASDKRITSDVTCEKVRNAGPLRTIVKGKAKVAAAPSEADWEQAAVYRIALDTAAIRSLSTPLLNILYRGDCARLYAGGRLVADNFYYGRPFLYG